MRRGAGLPPPTARTSSSRRGWRQRCIIRRRAVLILLGRVEQDALNLQPRAKPLYLRLESAHSAGLMRLMPPVNPSPNIQAYKCM
ncbi:hypothetical protein JCGZ_03820 [Jatropha curcas]|uniref:Uncharacterized protein n=1 Tax=Jatropha curcas TaxID=180498 RepID=A0A067JFI9_JATCU|nr:hypothetical protein JCGZ_03820 [Jatropha curcas]